MILFGEHPLWRALSEFSSHYHSERNHQGKAKRLLFPDEAQRRSPQRRSIVCCHRIRGLLKYISALHEYFDQTTVYTKASGGECCFQQVCIFPSAHDENTHDAEA